MKRSKQFRGKVPQEPVDADDRAKRKEPEAPPKIGVRKGSRPVVQKMRIMKKRAGRGR